MHLAIFKDKLFQLLQKIHELDPQITGRPFVDSAPVLERRLAQKAGLGWIGKNGMLISKEVGSYCFIGELFINIELDYDSPFEKEYCGSCEKCIDACPTKALISPRHLDSRKCISYHTIESKENIPYEIAKNQNGWIFGCDICQEVCPWNKIKMKSAPSLDIKNSNRNKINEIKDDNIEASIKLLINGSELTKDKFQEMFASSALLRAGFEKIKNNITAQSHLI
jgi:epoxyqueuosine reductase